MLSPQKKIQYFFYVMKSVVSTSKLNKNNKREVRIDETKRQLSGRNNTDLNEAIVQTNVPYGL